MKKQSRRKKKQAAKPSHDVAQDVQRQARESTSGFARLRDLFLPGFADIAQRVIDGGGLSLAEVQAIEFAELIRLTEIEAMAIEALANGDRSGTLLGRIVSVKLQSRKHLRAIAETLNPGQDPNDATPELPAEMAGYNVADPLDYGDDLVN